MSIMGPFAVTIPVGYLPNPRHVEAQSEKRRPDCVDDAGLKKCSKPTVGNFKTHLKHVLIPKTNFLKGIDGFGVTPFK